MSSSCAAKDGPKEDERTKGEAGERDSSKPKVIKFYERDQPHYGFTNFSTHPVEYEGKEYPTSEHLFQALKFMERRPDLAEHIRTASKRPRVALIEARKFEPEVREDWLEARVHVMDEILRYKFTQHPKLLEELIETGDAILVEDAGKLDAFWGNGADGKGQNQLGKALMRLRKDLGGK